MGDAHASVSRTWASWEGADCLRSRSGRHCQRDLVDRRTLAHTVHDRVVRPLVIRLDDALPTHSIRDRTVSSSALASCQPPSDARFTRPL